MSTSPTQLSLRALRADGFTAEVVERWNPHTRTRHDLFGFGDIIAIRAGEVLLVQTTSDAHVAERVRKIADAPTVAAVRDAGIGIHVHGWRKTAGRWQLRTVDVS